MLQEAEFDLSKILDPGITTEISLHYNFGAWNLSFSRNTKHSQFSASVGGELYKAAPGTWIIGIKQNLTEAYYSLLSSQLTIEGLLSITKFISGIADKPNYKLDPATIQLIGRLTY